MSRGRTLYVPAGVYPTDPFTVPGDVSVVGDGESSIFRLKPQNLDTLGDHAVVTVKGTLGDPVTGVTHRDYAIDGNVDAHTGTKTANMEGLHFEHVTDATLARMTVYDVISEGIDLDGCIRVLATHSHVSGCGGYGIHVSVNSTRNIIGFNVVTGCGRRTSRGGIDQYQNASDNTYLANLAADNYRNYHIEGSGAVFGDDNRSFDGDVADVLTGVN